MGKRFEGRCVGGPYDKMMLAHWARSKEFSRPMVAATMLSNDAPVEAVKVGEYRLNDFGQWHWWATDEGRAFEKLFGSEPS